MNSATKEVISEDCVGVATFNTNSQQFNLSLLSVIKEVTEAFVSIAISNSQQFVFVGIAQLKVIPLGSLSVG